MVGGGIIGLSIARELKARGLDVVVFEKGRTASEASWAGAGMLAPGGEKFPGAAWASRARLALDEYPAWIRSLESESGLTIDFKVTGARELREGAWVESTGDAIVDPRDVCRALAANLRVEEGCEIRELDPQLARSFVVAAGAWSGSIAGAPPAVPVKGWLIAYDMPPHSLPSILRQGCGHTYILQRSSGLTLVGSTEERVGFDRSADPGAVAALMARGEALWPELQGRTPVDAWCGFRPATPSGLPEHGRLPGANVWLCYGHYRNGILLAPVAARLIADDLVTTLKKG